MRNLASIDNGSDRAIFPGNLRLEARAFRVSFITRPDGLIRRDFPRGCFLNGLRTDAVRKLFLQTGRYGR